MNLINADQLKEWYHEKGLNFDCPKCGNRKRLVQPNIHVLFNLENDGNTANLNTGHHLLSILCHNCGYVEFFSKTILEKSSIFNT